MAAAATVARPASTQSDGFSHGAKAQHVRIFTLHTLTYFFRMPARDEKANDF
jgi:hypothetical protein